MFVATGDVGWLRVGYQRAGTIRAWRLACPQDTIGATDATVTARVATIDEFWATQRPMRLGLWMNGMWWVWNRVVEVEPELEVGAMVDIVINGNPAAQAEF